MDTNLATTISDAETESVSGAILLIAAPEAHKSELASLLRSQGHRVLFPPSVMEAVTSLNRGDLLLLKVAAIGAVELEMLRTIRATAAANHVPVIIVADSLETQAVVHCLELGAEDCLLWPVNGDLLLARTKAAVRRKQIWDAERMAASLTEKGKGEAEILVNSLIALSTRMCRENDPLKLLEMILVEGMRIADCEGGSIYMCTEDKQLEFVLVRNDMLDINMGGSSGKPINFKPLRLYDEKGHPNHRYVANHAAITGQTVNIVDAYETGRFDFFGTREFDKKTGYHSKSFLTVPLKDERLKVIGVLQLINSRNSRTGVVDAFDSSLQPVIEAFAVLAAAVMSCYRTPRVAGKAIP